MSYYIMPLFILKFNPVGVLAIYENIKFEVQGEIKMVYM